MEANIKILIAAVVLIAILAGCAMLIWHVIQTKQDPPAVQPMPNTTNMNEDVCEGKWFPCGDGNDNICLTDLSICESEDQIRCNGSTLYCATYNRGDCDDEPLRHKEFGGCCGEGKEWKVGYREGFDLSGQAWSQKAPYATHECCDAGNEVCPRRAGHVYMNPSACFDPCGNYCCPMGQVCSIPEDSTKTIEDVCCGATCCDGSGSACLRNSEGSPFCCARPCGDKCCGANYSCEHIEGEDTCVLTCRYGPKLEDGQTKFEPAHDFESVLDNGKLMCLPPYTCMDLDVDGETSSECMSGGKMCDFSFDTMIFDPPIVLTNREDETEPALRNAKTCYKTGDDSQTLWWKKVDEGDSYFMHWRVPFQNKLHPETNKSLCTAESCFNRLYSPEFAKDDGNDEMTSAQYDFQKSGQDVDEGSSGDIGGSTEDTGIHMEDGSGVCSVKIDCGALPSFKGPDYVLQDLHLARKYTLSSTTCLGDATTGVVRNLAQDSSKLDAEKNALSFPIPIWKIETGEYNDVADSYSDDCKAELTGVNLGVQNTTLRPCHANPGLCTFLQNGKWCEFGSNDGFACNSNDSVGVEKLCWASLGQDPKAFLFTEFASVGSVPNKVAHDPTKAQCFYKKNSDGKIVDNAYFFDPTYVCKIPWEHISKKDDIPTGDGNTPLEFDKSAEGDLQCPCSHRHWSDWGAAEDRKMFTYINSNGPICSFNSTFSFQIDDKFKLWDVDRNEFVADWGTNTTTVSTMKSYGLGQRRTDYKFLARHHLGGKSSWADGAVFTIRQDSNSSLLAMCVGDKFLSAYGNHNHALTALFNSEDDWKKTEEENDNITSVEYERGGYGYSALPKPHVNGDGFSIALRVSGSHKEMYYDDRKLAYNWPYEFNEFAVDEGQTHGGYRWKSSGEGNGTGGNRFYVYRVN